MNQENEMDQSLTTATLAIPMAFIILCVVSLWLVIWSKGWWGLKMAVIAGALYFSLAVMYSIGTYLGWPSPDPLPPLFVVHWAYVQEPSKVTNDPGGIYFMLRELEHNEDSVYFKHLAYKGNKNEPRIYSMPYSKEDQKLVQQMQDGLKKGKVFIGGKNSKKGKGGNGEGEGGQGQGQGGIGIMKGAGDGERGGFSFSHSKETIFHELPPSVVPEKIK